jgi:fructose-specific component phosphotransferase system IIB-like protein
MKKLTILLTGLFVSVAAMAQMAIPGAAFADNPSRFNGRKVTVKDVAFDFSSTTLAVNAAPLVGSSTALSAPVVAPTANGANTPTVRCNPPRGFTKVNVNFYSAPTYKGCFFMADQMLTQLEREAGAQSVEAEITFRGDSRTGYNLTLYRLKF